MYVCIQNPLERFIATVLNQIFGIFASTNIEISIQYQNRNFGMKLASNWKLIFIFQKKDPVIEIFGNYTENVSLCTL